MEGYETFKMQGSAGKADHCNLICHSWLISMGGLPSYKEKLKKRSGKGVEKEWKRAGRRGGRGSCRWDVKTEEKKDFKGFVSLTLTWNVALPLLC